MTAQDSNDKAQRASRPRTPAEWSAYRCQASCKIGRDALEGKTHPPDGCSRLDYAVFNLLHAVEELAIGFARYEALRRLNPRQYRELHERNMKGENFDGMVDALVMANVRISAEGASSQQRTAKRVAAKSNVPVSDGGGR